MSKYFNGYKIKEDGRVFKGEKEIKWKLSKDGYPKVKLKHNGITNSYSVRHLVSKVFLLKDSVKIEYIDGNKMNNHYTNLFFPE